MSDIKPVKDFLNFLFSVVDKTTLKSGEYYTDLPSDEYGKVYAKYLMGTYGQYASDWLLDYCYEKYYSSLSRDRYATLTAGWVSNRAQCFDCQGLLDYFMGIDINAKSNYIYYCSEKSSDFEDFENNPNKYAGWCLFKGSKPENIYHVGYVVGIANNGNPLIIEGKSIESGIVMSEYKSGAWTYIGKPDKLLEYDESPNEESTVFKVTSPMQKGEKYSAMQNALNLNGYSCTVDGKWGKKSQKAFEDMLLRNTDKKHIIITADGDTMAEFDI